MSIFTNLSINQAMKILEEDPRKINQFEINNLIESNLFEQVFKEKYGYFIMLDNKKKTERVCEIVMEKEPTLFEQVPKNLRTTKVKLEVLKKQPQCIELFDKNDFDYETVKYLYINFPFILEEINHKQVIKIIDQLKKEGIVQVNYSKEDEE